MKYLDWIPTFVNILPLTNVISLKLAIIIKSSRPAYDWLYYSWHYAWIALLIFVVTCIFGVFLIWKNKRAAVTTLVTSAIGILLLYFWGDSFCPW